MKRASLWIALLAAFSPGLHAAGESLDELNLEDLIKTDITSVSRKSQSMADIPAAAFVITAEDIRRSGAQALPDVLRMAPGIEVAQIDNGRYAVSARGFNGRFANKLQVLVDGRSIYHPMFSGVMWELDPIPLEDIERIEIIRGAGAVMWGANAVNGVINIISKHTRHQEGAAISIAGGNKGAANVYARIGQQVSEATSWKLSAQGRRIDPSRLHGTDTDSVDSLENAVVDFRLDQDLSNGRDLSIWGNASHATTRELWDLSFPGIGLTLLPVSPTQKLHSESLVGRYRWLSDHGIESSIQASVNTSGIDITNFIHEERTTYDLDYQGRYAVGRHDILWGFSHRHSSDEISTNAPYIAMLSPASIQRNTGLFVHDDWTLIPEHLKLGLGVRGDKTSRNGTNFSANATLLWTPTRSDSAWLKFAQAPRTSARGERDISILAGASMLQFPSPFPGPAVVNLPMITYVSGSGHLDPEKAKGVEIGFRKQFSSAFSADINAYRYRYTKLRSGGQAGMGTCAPGFPGIPFDAALCTAFGIPFGTPLIFNYSATNNGGAGWSDGVEVSADWLVAANWRLQLSYTWSKLRLDASDSPSINAGGEMLERATPRHFGSLRSQWNITRSQQFDVWVRGSAGFDRLNLIDPVPSATGAPTYTHVPGYVTLDLRYAYRVNKDLEFSLIGRNLLHSQRLEYASDFLPIAKAAITPSWMVSTRWSF